MKGRGRRGGMKGHRGSGIEKGRTESTQSSSSRSRLECDSDIGQFSREEKQQQQGREQQSTPQKVRWCSPLALVRHESQGLIGRYRCCGLPILLGNCKAASNS